MEYRGKHKIFDTKGIKTYPLKERISKVSIEDIIDPQQVINKEYNPGDAKEPIERLALKVIKAREKGKPVILFTGAHLIKNGLSGLIIDLIKRGIITLLAGNGAVSIHDFELALAGKTSEYVPNGLREGRFGMAKELSFINTALIEANKLKLGYGEALGRFIHDSTFKRSVEEQLGLTEPIKFKYPDYSLISNCYRYNIPLTIHASIGTDVIDQHYNFDGEAKGGCSGRDFLIFTEHICQVAKGGVVINIGSAVTGPEVLLKAVSMAANIGKGPSGIITADFDLKPYNPGRLASEENLEYYYRDHKSVVMRIPQAFDGEGLYIHGNQKITVPYFYKRIVQYLDS